MKGLLAGVGIGLAFGAVSLLFFNLQHALLIGIVALLVTWWTNEALPLGVVSLLPMILFPSFGLMDTDAVAANYAKSIIFLFLGGFMLAIAIEKTGLHHYFSIRLLHIFPRTNRGIIYALAFTSALLSAFLSNTTITLMLMPIALFLSDEMRLKVRFLLAIAYGASIGGILTPIGTPPNLILLGFLQEQGIQPLAFGEWMVLMSPIVILMLLIMPWLLSMGIHKEPVESIRGDIPILTHTQKRLFRLFILLSCILVGNTFLKELLGFALNEIVVLLGFGLLMLFPKIGFLTWEDTKKIPYEIIFLFGAGFSIAAAFSQTGLAADIASKLSFISGLPFLWMIVLVAGFVTFATEVTSNTALTSISLPIFYEFAKQMPSKEGEILLLAVTVAASYAFMLPIATPPNAIVMSSRVISIKAMANFGMKLNLIGIVVLSLSAYFFWGLLL